MTHQNRKDYPEFTVKVRIIVNLKEGVLDPGGEAVRHSLHELGYKEVKELRIGKAMDLVIDDHLSKEQIECRVREMTERLLSNPVIESYEWSVL